MCMQVFIELKKCRSTILSRLGCGTVSLRMVQRPLAETRSLDKGYAGALMSDPRICVPAKDLKHFKTAKLARQRKELLGDERSFLPTKPTLVGDIGFGLMAVAPSATSALMSQGV
jgi:hypothetical protein